LATGLSEAVRKTLLAKFKEEHLEPYVQLHTGDPGSSGTANVAGETTRKKIKLKGELPLVNEGAAEWAGVSTAETYKDASLWTAATGGTWLCNALLEAEKTVGVGDTAKLPAEGLSVTIAGA
jgi:hypothetical protein